MPSPLKAAKGLGGKESPRSEDLDSRGDGHEEVIVVLSGSVVSCEEAFRECVQDACEINFIKRQCIDVTLEELEPVLFHLNTAVLKHRKGLHTETVNEDVDEKKEDTEGAAGEFVEDPFVASELVSGAEDAVALLFKGPAALERVSTFVKENAQVVELIRSALTGGEEETAEPEGKCPEEGINLARFLMWSEDQQSFQILNEFCFVPSPLSEIDALTPRRGYCPPACSNRVSMETLITFLFPWDQQHPRSTGRLFVFGAYGPLDTSSNMRAGIRGQHRLQKHEIDGMVDQVDFDDILHIYIGDQILTPEEQQAVHSQANPALKEELQLTKEEVCYMFRNVERDEDGTMCFHELQKIIFAFRKERMRRWLRICQSGVEYSSKS